MRKGFTLIEVVVVLLILGILAAVAIPKINEIMTGKNKYQEPAEEKMIRQKDACSYCMEEINSRRR